jgi:hypothetical protein
MRPRLGSSNFALSWTYILKDCSPLTGNFIENVYASNTRHSGRLKEHPFFQGHFVLFLTWISNFKIWFGVTRKTWSLGWPMTVALLSPQLIFESFSNGSI